MVATVPAPAFADPTSVIGRRVGAAVIDGVIVFGPALALEASTLEYLDVADTAFSNAGDYCDAYIEQESGFCMNVDDTVAVMTASDRMPSDMIITAMILPPGVTGVESP